MLTIAPPSCRSNETPDHGAGDEPFALQVHRQHFIELLLRQFEHRDDRFDAGVIHQEAGDAKLRADALHHGIHLRRFGDVRLQPEGAPPQRPHLLRHLFPLGLHVANGNIGAGSGQAEGNCPADAASGPGHQRNLSAEVCH